MWNKLAIFVGIACIVAIIVAKVTKEKYGDIATPINYPYKSAISQGADDCENCIAPPNAMETYMKSQM